jgi:hypothetical protein
MAATIYQPHITSYDYDCPVGEAGGYGQPGIGGTNKFEVCGPRDHRACGCQHCDAHTPRARAGPCSRLC